VNKRSFFFVVLYFFSFLFLILNLNFNVRTFRLTQNLQELTLELQQLEHDVNLKELSFYTQTSLDRVYRYAEESLGMIRQNEINVFVKDDLDAR
tara:strand:+ start:503 stop:784 length:282 start_codon:yes stop_codon:yes gene_type:complete